MISLCASLTLLKYPSVVFPDRPKQGGDTPGTSMHARTYVRMYVFMYVRAYVCMHVCMYARMYVCMHVFMYVCTHACIYVCICT